MATLPVPLVLSDLAAQLQEFAGEAALLTPPIWAADLATVDPDATAQLVQAWQALDMVTRRWALVSRADLAYDFSRMDSAVKALVSELAPSTGLRRLLPRRAPRTEGLAASMQAYLGWKDGWEHLANSKLIGMEQSMTLYRAVSAALPELAPLLDQLAQAATARAEAVDELLAAGDAPDFHALHDESRRLARAQDAITLARGRIDIELAQSGTYIQLFSRTLDEERRAAQQMQAALDQVFSRGVAALNFASSKASIDTARALPAPVAGALPAPSSSTAMAQWSGDTARDAKLRAKIFAKLPYARGDGDEMQVVVSMMSKVSPSAFPVLLNAPPPPANNNSHASFFGEILSRACAPTGMFNKSRIQVLEMLSMLPPEMLKEMLQALPADHLTEAYSRGLADLVIAPRLLPMIALHSTSAFADRAWTSRPAENTAVGREVLQNIMVASAPFLSKGAAENIASKFPTSMELWAAVMANPGTPATMKLGWFAQMAQTSMSPEADRQFLGAVADFASQSGHPTTALTHIFVQLSHHDLRNRMVMMEEILSERANPDHSGRAGPEWIASSAQRESGGALLAHWKELHALVVKPLKPDGATLDRLIEMEAYHVILEKTQHAAQWKAFNPPPAKLQKNPLSQILESRAKPWLFENVLRLLPECVSLADASGKTPLEVAIQWGGNTKVAVALVELGAPLLAGDGTPLLRRAIKSPDGQYSCISMAMATKPFPLGQMVTECGMSSLEVLDSVLSAGIIRSGGEMPRMELLKILSSAEPPFEESDVRTRLAMETAPGAMSGVLTAFAVQRGFNIQDLFSAQEQARQDAADAAAASVAEIEGLRSKMMKMKNKRSGSKWGADEFAKNPNWAKPRL